MRLPRLLRRLGLGRRPVSAPVAPSRPRPPGVAGRRATPRPVIAGAVAGGLLVLVGLWLAWVPLALMVSGSALLAWAFLFDDDEKGGEV